MRHGTCSAPARPADGVAVPRCGCIRGVEPPSDAGDARDSALLRDLAAAYDVDVEYWDWQGNLTPISDASLRAVLAAFDVDADDRRRVSGRA